MLTIVSGPGSAPTALGPVRRGEADHDVKVGRQLADLRLLDRLEIDQDQLAVERVADFAQHAVALILLVAVDEDESPDGLFRQKNASKAPGILLNAELARFVVNRLLERPFTAAFGFDTSQEVDRSKANTMQTLHAIYLYLRRGM